MLITAINLPVIDESDNVQNVLNDAIGITGIDDVQGLTSKRLFILMKKKLLSLITLLLLLCFRVHRGKSSRGHWMMMSDLLELRQTGRLSSALI